MSTDPAFCDCVKDSIAAATDNELSEWRQARIARLAVCSDIVGDFEKRLKNIVNDDDGSETRFCTMSINRLKAEMDKINTWLALYTETKSNAG